MSSLSKPVQSALASESLESSGDSDFLLYVGKRVRDARSRRGMTRKMLAQEAEVSERHLAQIELGDGNVSIILLRRITNALNIPVADVFQAEKQNSATEVALRQILDRIPPINWSRLLRGCAANSERMTNPDARESH